MDETAADVDIASGGTGVWIGVRVILWGLLFWTLWAVATNLVGAYLTIGEAANVCLAIGAGGLLALLCGLTITATVSRLRAPGGPRVLYLCALLVALCALGLLVAGVLVTLPGGAGPSPSQMSVVAPFAGWLAGFVVIVWALTALPARPVPSPGRQVTRMLARVGAVGLAGVACLALAARSGAGMRNDLGWLDEQRLKPEPRSLQSPSPNGYDAYVAAGELLVEPTWPDDPEANASWVDAVIEGDTRTVVRQTAEVRDIVKRNRKALAKAREGASQECAYTRPLGTDTPFPEYAKFRSIARVGSLSALLDHCDGKDAEALQQTGDLYALGVHCPRGGPLTGMLVGVAVVSIAERADTYILLNGSASAEDLLTHAARVRKLRGEIWPFSEAMRAEYEMASSFYDLIESGDAEAVARFLADGDQQPKVFETQLMLWLAPPAKSREWADDRYARIILASEAGDDALLRKLSDSLEEEAIARRDHWAGIIMPVFAKAKTKQTGVEAQLAAIEVIAALQAYRGQHSAYPKSLSALVPEYLPAVPKDPWTGGPMLYEPTGDVFRLYCTGDDRTDDGGLTDPRRTRYEQKDQVFVPIPVFE